VTQGLLSYCRMTAGSSAAASALGFSPCWSSFASAVSGGGSSSSSKRPRPGPSKGWESAAAGPRSGWVGTQTGPLRPGQRSRGKPSPLTPAAEAFLEARGVDVSKLAKALRRDAKLEPVEQLPLEQVAGIWQLLEEYKVPDVPALLRKAPRILAASPERNLRPKLEALGIEGQPLAWLLTSHPDLAEASLYALRPTLAWLQHYVAAAADDGLLPAGTTLQSLLAAKPQLLGKLLLQRADTLDAGYAAMRRALGFTQAQYGAALTGKGAIASIAFCVRWFACAAGALLVQPQHLPSS
jgi:hypothetical protein